MDAIEIKLQEYQSKWNLTDVQLLASTPTSFIFEVHQEKEALILKIFTPTGAVDEKHGAEVLNLWNGQGAAKVIAHDEGAVLLEKLYGPNLYSFSELDREDLASELFISIIKKIHAVKVPEQHHIPTLKKLFEPLYKFQTGPEEIMPLVMQALFLADELQMTEERTVVLHGDLHHENVMRRSSGDYVCFDPKGLIGDPCYEIATILKNPWDYPQISHKETLCIERAAKFANSLKLSYERIIKYAFVHMCLSMMWALEDGRDYSHPFEIAQFLEKHVQELALGTTH